MRTFVVLFLLATVVACSSDPRVTNVVHTTDASSGKSDAQIASIDSESAGALEVSAEIDAQVEHNPLTCLGAAEGTVCVDVSHCLLHGECHDRACVADVNPCEDGNVCTDDSCDPNDGCRHLFNAATCTDNNACSLDDQCSAGSCNTFSALNCDDGNACTDDWCQNMAGCVHATVSNGVACSGSANACTSFGYCKQGVCTAAFFNCSDDDPCTLDSCDPQKGCVHTPKSCDDGNPWTFDVCGKSGGPKQCDNILIRIHFTFPNGMLNYAWKDGEEWVPAWFVKGKWNLPDEYIPHDPFSYSEKFLDEFCKKWPATTVAAMKFNVGYNHWVGGYQKDYVFIGGHLLKFLLMAGDFVMPPEMQPALLPVGGTQEYDAGGKAIPQDYHSPSLDALCTKFVAQEKKP